MRVVCTAVIRNTPSSVVPHGWIYDIDWDHKKVIQKLPVPQSRSELLLNLNPRGGIRGGRGVAITSDAIWVANYDTLFEYDHSWKELRRLSNPLLSDIHEIAAMDDGIWVSSTGVDLAVKIDFTGKVSRVWSPRTCAYLKSFLGIEDKYTVRWPPKTVGWGWLNAYKITGRLVSYLARKLGAPERRGYPWHVLDVKPKTAVESWLWRLYRKFPVLSSDDFHLNSVHCYEDETYVTLLTWPWREKACVVRIEPDFHVELGDTDLSNPHNGQIIDKKRLILNDTVSQAVKVFERGSGKPIKVIHTQDMGIEGCPWLRGLKQIGDDKMLIGIGNSTHHRGRSKEPIVPTQIVELDIRSGETLNRMILTVDRNTCLHGLDAVI